MTGDAVIGVNVIAAVLALALRAALPSGADEGECKSCGQMVGPNGGHDRSCPYD